jgi:hypothetical protein
MKIFRIILVFTLLIPLCENTSAGWLLTGKNINGEGRDIPERIFIEQHKIKMEWPDLIATFDLKAMTLILVDPVNLTYYQGNLSEYTDGVKAFKLSALKESMNGIPEEQAVESQKVYGAQIEHYFNIPQTPPGSVSVKKTDIELKMAGYLTAKYDISLNGIMKEEVWIASGIQVGDGFDWSIFNQFLKATGIEDKALVYMNSPEYFDLLKTGFPLCRIKTSDGLRTEFLVNSLEEKTIPDYEFYTPTLCKKLTIAGWLGQQMDKEDVYDDYE